MVDRTKSSPMAGLEDSYRRFLDALAALLAATRSDSPEVTAAAQNCAEAAALAIGCDSHLIVQERAGALFVNSVRVRPALDAYESCVDLAERMGAAAMSELLVMPMPGPEEWLALACAWREDGHASAIEAELAQGAEIGRVHV